MAAAAAAAAADSFSECLTRCGFNDASRDKIIEQGLVNIDDFMALEGDLDDLFKTLNRSKAPGEI